MADIQIKISSSSITEQVVTPAWNGEITIENETDQVYYRKKFNTDFTFRGADYTLIDGADDCEEITLDVYQYCNSDWELYHSGTFTKMDCSFDRIQCRLSVKPKEADDYNCLEQNFEEEISVYGASAAVETRAFQGTYIAGAGCCVGCQPTPAPVPCDDFGISGSYCTEYVEVGDFDTGACPGEYQINTCYHRIVGTGTTVDPPPYGTSWTYISGNDWWRCPAAAEIAIGVLSYGRRFDDVLEYLVAQTGCTLTVRSHFFDINATHAAAPSNDAYTFADTYLQNMTVHQKSDVKRPDGSNPAFSWVWNMKLKDLLDDLREMFEVYWKVDGSSLIIEHVSYFETTAGLDVSAHAHPQQYEGSDEAPQKEKYYWSDPTANYGTAFEGWPIIYDCGDGTKEHRVKLFTTDIATVKNSANAEDIADKNFVLVSNYYYSGAYEVANYNYPLGWQELHDNLHRNNRLFPTGTIANTAGQTFLSTKKTRKIKAFTVEMCCDSTFDPAELVTTNIGDAKVGSVVRNIIKDRATLNLLI